MRRGLIVLLWTVLVPLAPLHAGEAQQRLASLTADLRTLAGGFEQRVHDTAGTLTEHSSGTLALAAPRQFRWETLAPFPQLILADGDRVWIYDPDLEQVTVRRQGIEEQGNPLLALVDPEELERQFVVAEGGHRDGFDWVVLTPRQPEAGQIEAAWLGLAGGELARMELEDALGQRTVIEFRDWRRNPDLPAGTFTFEPPPGVDVVGEPGDDAEVHPLGD